jgi:hypothetical protein
MFFNHLLFPLTFPSLFPLGLGYILSIK